MTNLTKYQQLGNINKTEKALYIIIMSRLHAGLFSMGLPLSESLFTEQTGLHT